MYHIRLWFVALQIFYVFNAMCVYVFFKKKLGIPISSSRNKNISNVSINEKKNPNKFTHSHIVHFNVQRSSNCVSSRLYVR